MGPQGDPNLCKAPYHVGREHRVCPPFLPAAARDQRNVDSPSAAVRSAARGLLYGQEQMAVAQVDLRLVSAVARPPYYAPY